jgi:hypothetical protein
MYLNYIYSVFINFFEVSGHNLGEVSDLRFLYRFLKLVVFYKVFLLSPLQCTETHCRN